MSSSVDFAHSKMPTVTVQRACELALQHHRDGRLAEAEALYRQILEVQPNHFDALHLLGVIAHQSGRGDVAVDLMRRAIALHPNHPSALFNIAEAYQAMGRLDEAIAHYQQAVRFQPNDSHSRTAILAPPWPNRTNWPKPSRRSNAPLP